MAIFFTIWIGILIVLPPAVRADKPCDDYPVDQYTRCEQHWKQINREAEAEMAAFGLRQLERRRNGTISADQHLSENIAFIKASGEKRLRLLRERMNAR